MATTQPNTEHVRITHLCKHVVHCPREFMPPGRLKRERARNCRSCRKLAREVAAIRNAERGLPVLDASRGTRDQILLAEELRHRHYHELCADPFVDNPDPIRWIARFAGQEDCLLESRGPEVCGRACAGDALAEEDAQFDRIFGDGAPAQRGQEEEERERPEDRGECLCVGCDAFPCRCDPFSDEPASPAEKYEIDPEGPCACEECGVVEGPGEPLDVTEGRLLCYHCTPQERPDEPQAHPAPKVALIGLARIHPSPLNPRKSFDEAGLEELAGSIREHGVMSPLIVRQEGTEFSVIAGERRLRAAKLAGLLNVPVIVREADDATTLSLMLVENLQREDLNPIEEAQAYQGLRELGWTLEQIGAKVGRSGPAVSNAMRLLALPEEVQGMVADGPLTAAHGRALLYWAERPEECLTTARNAIAMEWSSKAVEGHARADRADRERMACWKAERAAIAAENGAEAGSKGGETGAGVAPTEPLTAAWAAVDQRQAVRDAERQREREEYEASRAHWPARAADLAAQVARERGRAGSILTDQRAVALLAYNLLSESRLCVLQEILEGRGLADLLRFFDWSLDQNFTEIWAALSALPVETQLELAFEALMREEIHLLREGGTEPEHSGWYAGDGCAAASEVRG